MRTGAKLSGTSYSGSCQRDGQISCQRGQDTDTLETFLSAISTEDMGFVAGRSTVLAASNDTIAATKAGLDSLPMFHDIFIPWKNILSAPVGLCIQRMPKQTSTILSHSY